MENCGITDDNDDDSDDGNRGTINEFSTFVQKIHLHCKNLGITPSDIFSCIKDLLDFHSNTNSIHNSSSDLLEKEAEVLIKNQYPK